MPAPKQSVIPFLQGGGEMGLLIRSKDWSATTLGFPENWHPVLKAMTSMMLANTLPVLICWGEELIQLYNDHFIPILRDDKHPHALGESVKDTFAEVWEASGQLYKRVLDGESIGSENFQTKLTRNGLTQDAWFNFSYTPLRDDNGTVLGMLVVCLETTAKMQALEKLEVYQQNTRNMVLQAPVGMCIIAGDPLYVEEVNDLFLEIIGKQRKDFENKPYWDVNTASRSPYEAITEKVMRSGVSYHARERKVTVIRRGREEQIFVDFVYEPLRNDSDSVRAIMILATDVTEKVRTRTEREAAYEQMSLSRRAAELGTFDLDLIKGTMIWDERCRELFGVLHDGDVTYERDFVPGLHPEDRDRIVYIIENLYDRIVSNGDYDVEYRTVGQNDGKIRWLRAKGKVFFNEQDIATRFIGSVIDITDSKNYQQELQQIITALRLSEARFRNLIQSAPVGIAVFRGLDMIVESVNDGMLEIWGKPPSVTGKPLSKALPELESEGQPFLDLIRKVFRSGNSYSGFEERGLLMRNGHLEEGYFDFIFQPVRDEYGEVVSVMQIAIDVTQRVLARQEIERLEEMLLLAVEGAQIGIWQVNTKKGIVRHNAMLAKVFGFDGPGELTVESLTARMTEESREAAIAARQGAMKPNGTYDVTYCMHRFNDDRLIWVRSMGKTMPDENGDYVIFSGVVMDVTEQKQDEVRKNDFIGMVSHELKTPLTSLGGVIQILTSKLKDSVDPAVPVATTIANKQVKRMTNMINGFLNLSRLESGKIHLNRQIFDIATLLRDVIKETAVNEATHFFEFTGEDAVIVEADYDKISSVVTNLLSNAVKYSPKGKKVEVNLAVQGTDIQVCVKDEGIGIMPQDLDKLFERYYRVESQRTRYISGFGIGLYICVEIIKLHRGKIWATSEPGKGSAFYFTIPIR